METSEYDLFYESCHRVPMNSASSQRDFTDYTSTETFSTYTMRPRLFKRSIKTTYIDETTMLGYYDSPYNMKDLFPKGKNRRKPLNLFEKEMKTRDAYMSLLPKNTLTNQSEKAHSPRSTTTGTLSTGLPEITNRNVNIRNRRSSRITMSDGSNESKFFTPCTTTHANNAWVQRYKSINKSQILNNVLREQSYKDKILLKKCSYEQLLSLSLSSSLTSSLNKRRRKKC